MRGAALVMALTVAAACGCGARLVHFGATDAPPTAAWPTAPGPNVPGPMLLGAGKRATHHEEDIGEVTTDAHGRLVTGRRSRDGWRFSTGAVLDLYPMGGTVPGIAAEIARGRNAFSLVAPSATVFIVFEEGVEADNSWRYDALEGFRMLYRRRHPVEDWFWQAGVSQMRVEGQTNIFATSEVRDLYINELYVLAGLGWRFHWPGRKRPYSELTLTVMAGPEVVLPAEYRGSSPFTFGPLDARLSATVIGLTF